MPHHDDHHGVRRAFLLTAAVGLALLMAACNSPSPRPGPGAYSACMRKHGVTGALASPPPTSFPTSIPTSGSRKTVRVQAKAGAAMRACLSLAPRPGRPSGPG